MTRIARTPALVKAFALGIVLALVGLGAYTWWGRTQAAAALPTVTVYQSPTCGCCSKWVDHLRANGFEVTAEHRTDMSVVKAELGVPYRLTSCHTARVGDYVVEGHVPADDIKRLLRDRPPVAGLTVPGMPVGSPGMEQGARQDPYDVLAFTDGGGVGVFARYGAQ